MRYEPRGGTRALFLDRGREVALVGAAGTGKTVGALMKLHLTSILVPGLQSLVVRRTHASLVASTLVTFERFVATQEIASGEVQWFGGSGSRPAGYYYPNGSVVMVGGMDNPGKVLSMSLDRVVVDEADQLSLSAYEVLLTRMRGNAPTYKQIVAACNPGHPDHWLKKRADNPKSALNMHTSLHRDNPYLFDGDGTATEAGVNYIATLEGLTGIRRMRYLEGRWCAAEGLVFDDWSEDVNLIDAFPVPETWPLVLSVDFGFSHPMVIQWWRVDPDGRMYLTREISKSGVLVEDHARHVKAIMSEHPEEPRPVAVVCDHDLEDRRTLEKHLGLPTIPAKKAVTRGIQLMQSRIRPAGDGRPRLYVFRDSLIDRDDVRTERGLSRGLPAEMLSYVWAVERGSDGIPREVPVKDQDDSADCARYAVCYLDWHDAARAGNPARPPTAAAGTVAGGRLSTPVGR